MATPNMGMILPTDHDSADVWGVILDTAFGVIDGHTHAPGSGATILMSSLKVDADISWAFGGTQRAITDLRAIDFSPQPVSAMSSIAGGFFVSDGTGGLVANELYYRTTSGANVQITNGATLNFATFVGGIGGDYTAVGALEIFDDASDAYWFQQQVGASVRQYAKMRSADLSLYEFKAVGASPVPSFAVTLKSPTALAAPYALTFPGALPGSQQLVQLDNTGAITASNTVPGAVTLSAALTANSTITATGLITGNAGVTAAANQHITVSGTGAYKHGSRVKVISFGGFIVDNVAPVDLVSDSLQVNNANVVVADLGMNVGERITRIDVFVKDNATGTTFITVQLKSIVATTGVASTVASASSSGSGAFQTLPMTGLTSTVVSGSSFYLRAAQNLNNAVHYYGAEITYDRP